MVAPVSGPYTKTSTGPFMDKSSRGYRQAPPYNLALAYEHNESYGKTDFYDWNSGGGYATYGPFKENNWSLWSIYGYQRHWDACYSRAYEQYRSNVYSAGQAGLAEALAQQNQARQMIVQRLSQIANAAVAVKKCDFKRAAKILRTPVPKKVSNRKAASQNFLEYHFGWQPLMQDVENSVKLLVSDPPTRFKCRGRATEAIQTRYNNVIDNPWYFQRWNSSEDGQLVMLIQGEITVTNPNLFLASSLGLIDAALPWKLIPFSFVIDWFVNVEQVLSSLSDFYGLSTGNAMYSWKFVGTYNEHIDSTNRSPSDPWKYGRVTTRVKRCAQGGRSLGIPSPSLHLKPFRGLSVTRGITSIALILSVFSK